MSLCLKGAKSATSLNAQHGASHRCPPPCFTQKSVPPMALVLQPSNWHRFPPPCFLQKSVAPLAPVLQPSNWHSFPPPCFLHRPPFRAHFAHPSTEQQRLALFFGGGEASINSLFDGLGGVENLGGIICLSIFTFIFKCLNGKICHYGA